jgi:RNA polymerase nonessential primary-like sigma factor
MQAATFFLENAGRGSTKLPASAALRRDGSTLSTDAANPALGLSGWPTAEGTGLASALCELKRCLDPLKNDAQGKPVPQKADADSLVDPLNSEWPGCEEDAADASWEDAAADAGLDAESTETGPKPLWANAGATASPASTAASSLNIYLAEIRAVPPLSAAEEKAVALRIRAGDAQAVAQMIRAHLGLVVAVARSLRAPNMPLEDLIGDGNMGLIEAVSRFDPDRGVQFGTYARYWIKQSIRQGILNHSRTVRLPVHVIRDVTRVLREQRKGMPARDPAGAGDGTDRSASELGRIAQATGKSVNDVVQLMGHAQVPLSMDLPVGGEDSLVLGETLEDTERGTPESQLVSDQMLDTLLACVNSLSRIERVVVLRRYGFETGEPDTLENVGSLLGLTAERVRQIQKAALPKLREALLEKGLDAAALFG